MAGTLKNIDMKKIALLFLLALFGGSASAKTRTGAAALEFVGTPELVYRGDSMTLRLFMSIPPALDKAWLYEKVIVKIVSREDRELFAEVGEFQMTGKKRERYMIRESKRKGVEPIKMAWSKKYNARKMHRRGRYIVLSFECAREEWMDPWVIVRVEQWQTMLREDPLMELVPENFNPYVTFEE